MDRRYRNLVSQWKSNQSTSLLASQHAPIYLAFFSYLSDVYGRSPVSRQTMLEELRQYYQDLSDDYPDLDIRKDPAAALNLFTGEERKWLNAFYPKGQDEIHYTLSAGLEQALGFARDISSKPFYGTESRLELYLTGIDELHTSLEADPDVLVATLQQQRRDLMQKINDVKNGAAQTADDRKIREQYLTLVSLSRQLESDVYGVVGAFEELNRKTRLDISQAISSRSEALEKILSQHDIIQNSDQGKSFVAFFRLLMNTPRLDEIRKKIESIHRHDALDLLENTELDGFEYRLRDAATLAQRRFQDIAISLGRYLEEHRGKEIRHFTQLMNEISSIGIRLRGCPPEDFTMTLPEKKIPVNLNFNRELYAVKKPVEFIQSDLRDEVEIDLSEVVDTNYLQMELLRDQVTGILEKHEQVSLSRIIREFPVTDGLGEVVGYYSLAREFPHHVVEESRISITWTDEHGRNKVAFCPQLIFTRAMLGT